MKIGLFGLPNSGKTTIFNALTRSEAEVAAYANNRAEPNIAVVEVVDERVPRLSQLYKPLVKHLKPGARGMDFGSGPGPTLSVIFSEAGYPMTIYDKYYANKPEVLCRKYHFITMTEVAEHLAHPKQVFEQLYSCLLPGGKLAVMTQMMNPDINFAHWYYKKDPTHIVFYHIQTFHWLARHWQVKLENYGNNIVIFHLKS